MSFSIFSKDNLGSVRVVFNEETMAPWFVAKDVCDCLGIKNSRDAIAGLLDDEISDVVLTDTRSKGGATQARSMKIVSESGLYTLIMRSRKKEAIEFQRWVTREVLPSIRRTGSYSLQDAEKATAYKEDSNYWFEMYNRILDDYAKAMLERRYENDRSSDTAPSSEEMDGVWTNNQMFIISADGKYTVIEREMR